MSHNIIEVKNLNYKYPDGNSALNGVTFKINHGESVGIIGANGAGKSTLLMNIIGILFPNKGEVRIGDILVEKKTLSVIRKKVGIVFQNSDDQLFMTTVYDDVAFGPRNYKLSEEEVKNRVMTSLETVGISHLKDRPPYKLSGGEKRAAAIATVLAMNPDILVMDEPTTALDPKSRRRLINLLRSLPHTKIITTHDLDMVLELCNRVIVLNEGQIVEDSSTLSIFENDELMKNCGLERPLSMQNCPICGTKKQIKYRYNIG
ncbi:energy-coupling factor ABC transporter ATP-binding protein [Tepidibacter formicigenes]|jgi:cobalt/nickel transport system ATP-binding protein|uniref:Cobalt/nickel transport system ATP-binding protein n=1 Tax=Tepidibacter formicigenes DSM 15518 TaxID=1123349 RepID=A0A1M6L0G4_9FIRM|nr:ABC transporter ATP-binding protein [Tepidibacter formicigenes]SHJ64632.1 cobalt/nickel transport system ATP-binding protein [Tepidibacter formicigenes DSM 15518]